jgi:DNA modification methylase
MVEMGRVLKRSGSAFINLGDKYAGTGGNNNAGVGKGIEQIWEGKPVESRRLGDIRKLDGFRAKSLMGLPWRFAIRQIDAGWILRAELIWSKPNGLPESVTDRVRRSHEQWFHFVKKPRYFSAVDEIREPHADRRDLTRQWEPIT